MGIGQGDYLDLFLQADDFGPAMKRVQDSRLQGPDPVDVWFPKYQGILTGMSVWLGSTADPIWRVVDIRTVFPTEGNAHAWHIEAMPYNSERMPSVTDAPPVGQDCYVFGGTRPSPFAESMMLTAYYYLFRRDRVAVKLFVMQGLESASPLTPAIVASIAQCIDNRIDAVQRRGYNG